MKLTIAQTISRFLREQRGRCINCGRPCCHDGEKFIYCSMTCMCYDGVFSVKFGPLRDFKYSEGYYCNYKDLDNENYN